MTVPSAIQTTRFGRGQWRTAARGATAGACSREAAHDKIRLAARLRRVLTENPDVRHFTVQHIVKALGSDGAAPPIALFAAAGVLDAPDAAEMAGAVTRAAAAGLALGHPDVRLPRALLRRKIPRTSLALLIHGVSSLLDSTDGLLRERWGWVFHPLMTGTLGLILFLLGIASMAPIVGGGVQHAASAFLIAVGIAERDGLAVALGALAGLACLALAVLSVASWGTLWDKVRAWLLQCARKLRLDALVGLLDACCDGLGELLRLRWSGLLLILLSPGAAVLRSPRSTDGDNSTLRNRARRIRGAAHRACESTACETHGA